MASWCKTSTPRSKRSKRFSRRCSTSRGSTAAPCGRNFPNLPSTICCSGSPSSSRRSPARRASSSWSCPARSPSARTAACSDGSYRTSAPMPSNIRRRAACVAVAGGGGRGSRLRIDVCDTGIGIPPSRRRAVFKEFHRLDQGARVARGVGLGLSIVERIARGLAWEVVLQSVLDRGSRFSVEVPRAAAAVIRPDAGRALRPDAGSLAGTVVLCIDNERAILDGMQKLLGGWGCRVLTAVDLPEALAAMEASEVEPDGLLVDYHLDGGDGIAGVTEMRRRAGGQLHD